MVTIYWGNRNWQNSVSNILPYWKNYIHVINACRCGSELKCAEYILDYPKQVSFISFFKLISGYYPAFLLILENLILQFKVTQTLPNLRQLVQVPPHFLLHPCFSSTFMNRCTVLESKGVASSPALPSALPWSLQFIFNNSICCECLWFCPGCQLRSVCLPGLPCSNFPQPIWCHGIHGRGES